MEENFFMTSERPSRYQRGDRRYIGGQMRYFRSGNWMQASRRVLRKLSRTGSTRDETEVGPGAASQRKLVMQDTIHTVDSDRISLRTSGRSRSLLTVNTWASDRSLQARLLTWTLNLRMLESPTMEKTRSCDMMMGLEPSVEWERGYTTTREERKNEWMNPRQWIRECLFL